MWLILCRSRFSLWIGWSDLVGFAAINVALPLGWVGLGWVGSVRFGSVGCEDVVLHVILMLWMLMICLSTTV